MTRERKGPYWLFVSLALRAESCGASASSTAFIRERIVFKIQFIRYPLHDPSPKDVMSGICFFDIRTAALTFESGSLRISDWNRDRSNDRPLLQGCPSLWQWIISPCHPFTGFNAHLERDFLMTSVGSSAEKSRVHCKIVIPGGALKFPAAVSSWISTVLSHPSYFSVQAALNDLFQLPGYTWCTLLAQLLDRVFGPKCVSKALEQVSNNQRGNNPYIIAMVVIDLL